MAQMIKYKGQMYQRVDEMDKGTLKYCAERALARAESLVKCANELEKFARVVARDYTNRKAIQDARAKADWAEDLAKDVDNDLATVQKQFK